MKVIIEEYNPGWRDLFIEECSRLENALSVPTISIEHIGSTSITGLAAKPVIDIMIGLDSFSTASSHVEAIKRMGYEYIRKYEIEMPSRKFFVKSAGQIRTHHIHMVERNSEFWNRHLRFRDHLRSSPTDKERCQSLKIRLAKKEWIDMNDHANAKTEFINQF